MAQLSDDCFAFGGQLMSLDDALARLETRTVPVAGVETVRLAEAAGRIVAEDIRSEVAVPPHANAAVDGYAVYHADLDHAASTRLPVAGRVAAGSSAVRAPRRGEAVRIFTGAAMPAGTDGGGPDTVLMQEDCVEQEGGVLIPPGIARGSNRREAGEDIRPGDIVLRAGTRLRAQDVGLAASIGRTDLPVFAPLRVAVFSTGDELTEPGTPLRAGAIYDSNRYGLTAALTGLGCRVSDLGILPDDATTIANALARACAGHDLVVTSGGMSTGEEDHVRSAVESLGALHFWRLAIKPGRPVALGQMTVGGRGVPFAGLPGNPVAVMVTFLLLARPLVLRLAGARIGRPPRYRVTAGFGYRKKAGRREFVRAKLSAGPDGNTAQKAGPGGAGILSTMAAADGLVDLPESLTYLEPGETVDYLPFAEVLQ